MFEALLTNEVDAKEIESEDENINIYGNPSDLYKIKDALLSYKPACNILIEEVSMIPNEMVNLDGENKENFDKLINMLDDIEDVQKIYHNVIL